MELVIVSTQTDDIGVRSESISGKLKGFNTVLVEVDLYGISIQLYIYVLSVSDCDFSK